MCSRPEDTDTGSSTENLPNPQHVFDLTSEERRLQRERKYTISNGISILRVVLMPILMWAVSLEDSPERIMHVVVWSFVIGSTDFFDGFVARKLNQVSEWGKVFDPVADKICIGLSTVWLYLYCNLPLWVPVAVIGRDIIILIGAFVLFRKKDLVMPSNQLGRYTTGILTLTLFIYAIRWEWPQEVLIWASGIMVGVTLIVYTRNSILILRRYRPKP